MVKFSILPTGNNTRDIPYLLKELRQKNLISGVERDADGDPVYLTHNMAAVKKTVSDYDGIMIDIYKD